MACGISILLLLWPWLWMLSQINAILLEHGEGYNLGRGLEVSEMHSIGQTVFSLVDQKLNWEDAEAFCRSEFSLGAGTLAKPDTFQSHQLIRALMEKKLISRVWIGLYVDDDGQLQWADNSCSRLEEQDFNVVSDDPAEYKVPKSCFMLEEDEWESSICTNRRKFVCQYQDFNAISNGEAICSSHQGRAFYQPVDVIFYAVPLNNGDGTNADTSGLGGSGNYNTQNYQDGDKPSPNTGTTTTEVTCKSRCASIARCVVASRALKSCLLGIASTLGDTQVRRRCYRGEFFSVNGDSTPTKKRKRRQAPGYTCFPVKTSTLFTAHTTDISNDFTNIADIDLTKLMDTVHVTVTSTSIQVTPTIQTTTVTHSIPMTQLVTTIHVTKTVTTTTTLPAPTPSVMVTSASTSNWTGAESTSSYSYNPQTSDIISPMASVTSVSLVSASSVVITDLSESPSPYPCSSYLPADFNITEQELNDLQSSIIRHLHVDKECLSSTRRKKESSPDHRTTAAACGVLAVAFLTITIAIFVVLDVHRLTDAIKRLSRKLHEQN